MENDYHKHMANIMQGNSTTITAKGFTLNNPSHTMNPIYWLK
jgi:hypothetical protein